MRGKSNKNVPPAAPGRPFRNIFGGIEFAPPAPPRGRPPSVFKSSVAEPATLGKRSRTGLSPSFRKRTGTGDTSVSPVIIDWDIDNVTDENVDSAIGVREPRDWALVNAGCNCLLLLWIKDGLDNFEAVEQQIIDLAGIAEPLSSKRVRCIICAPNEKVDHTLDGSRKDSLSNHNKSEKHMINVGKQRSLKQREEAMVQQQLRLRAFLEISKDTKLKAKMVQVTTLMHLLSRGRAMLDYEAMEELFTEINVPDLPAW
jgi:hypothetical protein